VQRFGADGAQARIPASGLCLDVWCMGACRSVMQSCELTPSKVDDEVGAAIRESGIPRSEIFITTKFWPHFAAPENVELCLNQSLEKLGLDYVDLLLAHWPVAFKPISREALENADTSKAASKAAKAIMLKENNDDPVIDWEHTTANLASQAGKAWLEKSVEQFILICVC
jgi:aryl-alcohol dehydrogenase-like predicted oxidoreductase